MNNYKRLPMNSLGRKILGLTLASSMLLLSNAYATGLGKLTVLSSLGQPLRAEIELTSPNKDEIASLVPKLASVEAFKQSNIDFNPALLSLRFSVETRGAGYVIRVSSNQAMNEPFVDLLLEMNSSNGRLLREYTFLLDPAELRNSQSAQVASPVSVAPQASSSQANTGQNNRASGVIANTEEAAKKLNYRKKPEVVQAERAAGDYQVRPGDTLSKIAGNYKNEGVSLDQMLASLYKANPHAFSGSNMNRLKTGQVLTIPDADTTRSNTNAEAHSLVLAHANDFASYRNKLAGQVADSSAQRTAVSKQSASGVVRAKVKEVATPSNEATDKLKLSKAAAHDQAKSSAGKIASEEDSLAKQKVAAEAQTRVKELEKNVNDLQKILDVKNKTLAEKQEASDKQAAAEKVAAAEKAAADKAAVEKAVAASAAAATAAPASAPAATASSVASVPPAPKRKVIQPPPPPPPEPSWYENWGNFLLPGTAILAALGGYGLYVSRKKKKDLQFDDSALTGSSMKANSMFGSTGGQSVDTNNSVFNSNFAPSASQLDANEVDPVAEADVYIAYGRDTQAEEILKEALRTQPDRHAVRIKLLEIYASRKDTRSFERLASELYGMTSGEGEDWEQAASMGITLDPDNPLYAGGKKIEPQFSSEIDLGSEQFDDLDAEALIGNSLSKDMIESISVIDTAAGLSENDLPAVSEVKPEEVVAAMDLGDLDFDLDIPSEQDVSEPVSEVAESVAAAVPMLPEEQIEALAVNSQPLPENNSLIDFGLIDFELEESSSSSEQPAPSVQPAEQESSEQEAELALIADSEHHIDFEMPAEELNSVLPEQSLGLSEMPEIEAVSAEADKHEIDFDLHDEAAQEDKLPESDPFEFDLSGIDLDLNSEHAQLDDPVSEEVYSYNAEMATKLDLAVAYQEIGDKEGARELLEEVLKDGTPDQVEKARQMLGELGS